MLLTLVITSCTKPISKQVTNVNDYNNYLELESNKGLELAQNNLEFWLKKLNLNPNQFPYLSKLSGAYYKLFTITGKIEYLIKAEKQLIRVNETTHYKKSSYLKALAHNYISQHKFKDALELLTKAELIGDRLKGTQKMLFDVHLELGNYQLAESYLTKIKNFNDFDYLIRLSKWNDHKGNLDAAIRYLEKAKVIAEASNLKGIKKWTYTNLADFYGHAGNIETSYNHFLKALQLDPNDAYAKKGIAWIVFSHEKNPDEALRILNTITTTFFAPDYNLLKAQIAEFKGETTLKEKQLKLYKAAMNDASYGDMYNKYNVLLFADASENLDEAIAISKIEIDHRPTPQSYDLLAWSLYKKGDINEALNIVEMHIIDKTFEPMALYHTAEIYKAVGDITKANNIKKHLLSSVFELGPVIAKQINQI
jgi:tetratricopeptide (TPR) repeat protein